MIEKRKLASIFLVLYIIAEYMATRHIISSHTMSIISIVYGIIIFLIFLFYLIYEYRKKRLQSFVITMYPCALLCYHPINDMLFLSSQANDMVKHHLNIFFQQSKQIRL